MVKLVKRYVVEKDIWEVGYWISSTFHIVRYEPNYNYSINDDEEAA